MMKLKVYEKLITGKKYKWIDEKVKGIYINEYNELCYIDIYGNLHIACELRKDIDIYEIEE